MTQHQALQDRFQRNIVFCLQVRLSDATDALTPTLNAISNQGGRTGDVVRQSHAAGSIQYDITVFTTGDEQMATIRSAVENVDGCDVLDVLDMAMETHRGGACEVRSRTPITSNTDLRIVYTPGVARVCKAIEAKPELARDFTNIANRVAIVTNGTAILGLGDIGPVAGLPVMEGKAAIFWEFTGISADPVLVDTHDPDEFINVVEKIACGYGAIQIEDVSAPSCFKITRDLDAKLPIPVFHDDQHGTATVVLGTLLSALKKLGRDLKTMTCAIAGAGAAGTAIADVLNHVGIADVVLCDSAGTIHRGRENRMDDEKRALAERTNKDNVSGTLADAMKGRDLFIGVAQPGIVSKEMVESMASDPIVLALANPVSEISRDDALAAGACIYADGRMVNNAIAYPGIFRGALDAQASTITMDMIIAAAEAIASVVPGDQLLPEMMDPATHEAVAKAVAGAAPKN
jgi:malate dehydrogenase (oxaloacetate-decarboxylating)